MFGKNIACTVNQYRQNWHIGIDSQLKSSSFKKSNLIVG